MSCARKVPEKEGSRCPALRSALLFVLSSLACLIMPHRVAIEVLDEQDLPLVVKELENLWQRAAAAVLRGSPGPLGSSLAALDEVALVLLDDARIAAVHGEFLDDPTPTDVITFHHGEILISVETAARVAPEEGTSVFEEVLLYGVHGLVHLHGYDDRTPAERAVMEQIQQEILRKING